MKKDENNMERFLISGGSYVSIQKDDVSGNTITPLEALKMYGCLRLSARIYDLKSIGMPIKTERKTNGKKWFAEYSIL